MSDPGTAARRGLKLPASQSRSGSYLIWGAVPGWAGTGSDGLALQSVRTLHRGTDKPGGAESQQSQRGPAPFAWPAAVITGLCSPGCRAGKTRAGPSRSSRRPAGTARRRAQPGAGGGISDTRHGHPEPALGKQGDTLSRPASSPNRPKQPRVTRTVVGDGRGGECLRPEIDGKIIFGVQSAYAKHTGQKPMRFVAPAPCAAPAYYSAGMEALQS